MALSLWPVPTKPSVRRYWWRWPPVNSVNFERSSHFCCPRLHRSIRSTEDAKIFLVVRRGWQFKINRRSVTEEVRKRETHGDISSEETSLHLL